MSIWVNTYHWITNKDFYMFEPDNKHIEDNLFVGLSLFLFISSRYLLQKINIIDMYWNRVYVSFPGNASQVQASVHLYITLVFIFLCTFYVQLFGQPDSRITQKCIPSADKCLPYTYIYICSITLSISHTRTCGFCSLWSKRDTNKMVCIYWTRLTTTF